MCCMTGLLHTHSSLTNKAYETLAYETKLQLAMITVLSSTGSPHPTYVSSVSHDYRSNKQEP